MKNWREAAEKYRQAHPEMIKEEQNQKLRRAAQQLQEFLDSPLGKEALELLGASGRHIDFGVDDSTSAHVLVWYLDGTGLHLNSGRGGLSAAYSKNPSEPTISNISAEDAVLAAYEHGEYDPEQLMRRLREELDQIADAAPEPEPAK